MSDADEVIAAARARAAALPARDVDALHRLLHPEFRWASHLGHVLDRDGYVARNTDGRTAWLEQDLGDPHVTVVGGTAVLYTVVTDTIETAQGPETFRMPMTQTWVREEEGWRCLAGHAGPRL